MKFEFWDRYLTFAFRFALCAFLLMWSAYLAVQAANGLPSDVTVGVQVWNYQRIYPLPDGLFQDVSSTQIASLKLDPNAANATQLDALLQVFQAQAQYGATFGVQNGLAEQQAAAGSASAMFQAQLINRQSQLIQSQILVQNQVGIAQSTVDSLSSDGARKTDVDGAKQQLQRAKDNLVSITAQISDIKN